MTVWAKPVAWSKFVLGLKCPRQLQNTLDKVPHGFSKDSNYYAVVGILVQEVFELYFNRQLNLVDGGQEVKVVRNIARKVMGARIKGNTFHEPKRLPYEITYPANKDAETLWESVMFQVEHGFGVMKDMKLLDKKVRSEVKWSSTFRGFRMFCMIDFIVEGRNGHSVYDGKGSARKNADPRQVLYYALAVNASGHQLGKGGLIYWQHDFDEVDISPAALKEFIDGDFKRGRALFEQLKVGVNTPMETTPSKDACKYCNWRLTCADSVMKPDEVTPEQIAAATGIVEL